MRCQRVRSRLSEYLDRELPPPLIGAIAHHLAECAACAEEHRTLRATVDALGALPRPEPDSSVAVAVLDRLEVERRGPGLQLLFRSAWRARPLIVPSLLPATLVLALVLGTAFGFSWLQQPNELPIPAGDAWSARLPPSGTEANPLFPSAGVESPRLRSREPLPEPFIHSQDEASLFVETVVARDGSVSAVTVLDGDASAARALTDALRLERFDPALREGRPVAISLYRLYSRMVVHSRT
ncbi:MAG: zf-HC2 domain-containing protein [Vicinamibacteria bacterium]